MKPIKLTNLSSKFTVRINPDDIRWYCEDGIEGTTMRVGNDRWVVVETPEQIDILLEQNEMTVVERTEVSLDGVSQTVEKLRKSGSGVVEVFGQYSDLTVAPVTVK